MTSLPKSRRSLSSPLRRQVGLEEVDPHRGEAVGRAGDRLRLVRLLLEPDDPPLLVHLHHAEVPASLLGRKPDARHREAGALLVVEGPQEPVVHLVDVIAGEDEDEAWPLVLDEVGVLADGVGRPLVPAAPELLLGGDLVDELVQARAEQVPAGLEVVRQRVRLVLREDVDPPKAGVDAVGEGEVDDPEDAAERDRRLGPNVGERLQTFALSPGHDECEGVFHRALLSRRRTPRVRAGELKAAARPCPGPHGKSPSAGVANLSRPDTSARRPEIRAQPERRQWFDAEDDLSRALRSSAPLPSTTSAHCAQDSSLQRVATSEP